MDWKDHMVEALFDDASCTRVKELLDLVIYVLADKSCSPVTIVT